MRSGARVTVGCLQKFAIALRSTHLFCVHAHHVARECPTSRADAVDHLNEERSSSRHDQRGPARRRGL